MSVVNPGRGNGTTTVSALSGQAVNPRGRSIKRVGDTTGRLLQAQQDGLSAEQKEEAEFQANTAELVGLFSENKEAFRYLVQHQHSLPVLIKLAQHKQDLAEMFQWWSTLEYEDDAHA